MAKASAPVYSIFVRGMVPTDLVEHHPLDEGGGMVRLTAQGNAILDGVSLLRERGFTIDVPIRSTK